MESRDKSRGPEPDRLKLDEHDWEEAVRKAVKKPRPKGGWPDEHPKKGKPDPKK